MRTEQPPVFTPRREPADGFASTQWSMILAASAQSEVALEALCRTYWRPVYVYARASGVSRADAEDLTQDYFADMLRRDWLRLADPARGSFRGFLRVSVRHFLANRWRYAHAQKRYVAEVVPLDSDLGERHLAALAAPDLDPALLYEQSWADCVLDAARRRLAASETKRGRAAEYEQLQPFLSRPPSAGEYPELAAKLRVSPGRVAVMVHRLAKRFAALVRAEVASTLADPDDARDLEKELRHLLSIVSRQR